jgi:hypothetical protein
VRLTLASKRDSRASTSKELKMVSWCLPSEYVEIARTLARAMAPCRSGYWVEIRLLSSVGAQRRTQLGAFLAA